MRDPSFGDVHARHDLQSGGESGGKCFGRSHNLFQNAIGSESDSVVMFIGFEVNIGCTRLDRIYEHFVDESNDGSVVDLFRDAPIIAIGFVEGIDIEIVVRLMIEFAQLFD